MLVIETFLPSSFWYGSHVWERPLIGNPLNTAHCNARRSEYSLHTTCKSQLELYMKSRIELEIMILHKKRVSLEVSMLHVFINGFFVDLIFRVSIICKSTFVSLLCTTDPWGTPGVYRWFRENKFVLYYYFMFYIVYRW